VSGMIPDTFCILAGGRIFVKVRIDIFGCTDYDIAMKNIFKNIRKKNRISYVTDDEYEYCRYCEANLTLQKGYSNDLPYWVCKGCGQMLINPNLNTDSDIIWTCDGCETLLNEQPGFTEKNGSWKCTACGFVNSLDKNHVYVSEDEYQAAVNAPYNGISNEDMLALMSYEVIGSIENREDVLIVKDEDGNLYVEKILDTFDESIYQYLMEHPIANMPQIMSVYRGITKLVIIEQWIDGVTIEDMLKEYTIKEREAVRIACDICKILKELHSQKTPIIHRDVKPSNVMLCQDGSVYLLDVNVAKWCNPEEAEDTKLLGTLYYAAPEQFGYGFTASTEKTDIYAVGMLLNKMITGRFPKEERATGVMWEVIQRCIRLNPEERYSDDELINTLTDYLGEQDE